ncbi:MAG: tRNA pseudouridine(55) synthase TruB [Bacteroidales bacterium]|nr:tRNA pseudouridine(55) synthase TruB [Bacteroidales bacterium]
MENFSKHTTDFQSGVIIPVNKDLDWTSFDVVNKIRYLLKFNREIPKIKVGHAGTLDPKASGVLIVCTGKATKQISSLQVQNKTYYAKLKFGETTPSFDSETAVDETFPTEHITRKKIEQIIPNFVGSISQIPPAYSALHVNGKRAYDLARSGKTPELKARDVVIENINIERFELPYLELSITCHTGTYVRSLVRDIGQALQSGAWMCSLVRERSGDFHIDDTFTMEELKKMI